MTLRTIVLYPTLVFMVISSYSTFTLADEKETATNLTTLLRSARSVTVNKATIADPSQFDVSKFIKKTKKNYLRSAGKKIDKSDVMMQQLLDAIIFVIRKAKAGEYKDKWPSGQYAHQFLPARFARETGLKFSELTGGKGTIKLTTSTGLLVNPKNRPDAWESTVISSKFLSNDWPRDQVMEESTSEGYRLLLPEYYKSGCLDCHGGANGKSIHAEPISGNLGDFGGAISVILK